MNGLKAQRNDPCSCNSGKKFKRCCGSGQWTAQPPDLTPAVLLERGLAQHKAGSLDAAAAHYDDILRLEPTHADAMHLLGLIDFQKGRKADALKRIKAAIALSCADPRYFYNLGTVLMSLGRPHEAVEHFKTTIEMDPSHAQAHGNLGAALCETGGRDDAVASFRTALSLVPTDVDAWSNLSATLTEIGKIDEAMGCLQEALKLNPEKSSSLNNLGFALMKAGDTMQARACYARAIELDMGNAKAFHNLATLLLTNPVDDEPELSIQCYYKAIELNPDHPQSQSNLLMALQYSPNTTIEQLFAQHRFFGRHFETGVVGLQAAHENGREPTRRLKIGYVSADFNNHAVASFFEPILECHDRTNFEIFCYYNHTKDDFVTARLMARACHWTPCIKMSDEQLADRIRADGIDILVDLSGHTGGNRLLTFARKPAPVQVTWIGYPGTTGMVRMDYYFGDRFCLPEGEFDDQFTEKIVRLPASTTFMPYTFAPEVGPLPVLAAGHITFGSFNQPGKLTAAVIALWSKVLCAVPDSHMVIAGMSKAGHDDALARAFRSHGVVPERLRFYQRCALTPYLALHHEVDICLDTFPYNGGTTTLQAMWMGVPTLSIAGRTGPGRQSAAILGHAGLSGFLATDEDDFVRRGRELASDIPALAALRGNIRSQFRQSAMGQPPVATAGVEKAFRMMWGRWCAAAAPESFDVCV